MKQFMGGVTILPCGTCPALLHTVQALRLVVQVKAMDSRLTIRNIIDKVIGAGEDKEN